MTHRWPSEPIPKGELFVIEKCGRCGNLRTRFADGKVIQPSGKCRNTEMDERRVLLGQVLNSQLKFYHVGKL